LSKFYNYNNRDGSVDIQLGLQNSTGRRCRGWQNPYSTSIY